MDHRRSFGRIRTLALASFIALVAGVGIRSAEASTIFFTGGTVTLNDTSTQTTNNSVVWYDVDHYTESGFKLDFIPSTGAPFESIIGDYYSAGNDVIHGHWATGSFGGLTRIMVTKLDNTAFDLNYFVLTSNTQFGGGPASGLERAFIHASVDGTTDSFSQLLPPENWGFPATQIFLGTEFDGIKAFWFDVENVVDCFGMDNFYIDEAPPSAVPLPSSAWLCMSMFGLLGVARRARRRPTV